MAQADLLHVMCGQCAGVDENTREEGRAALRSGMSALLRTLIRRDRSEHARLGAARHGAVACVAAAQRALARQGSANQTEREALRRVLAGDLPDVNAGPAGDRAARQVVSTVRGMQNAAAMLRRAWRAAAGEEMARRAEREGGAEGARWRGVGMERWRQAVHALASKGGPSSKGEPSRRNAHGEQQEDEDSTRHVDERGGWTIATALILYKAREAAKRKERERKEEMRDSVRADSQGNGVVVFDVETTELVDEATPIRDMHVSVACAVHIPRGCTCADGDGVTRSTHWPEVTMHVHGGQQDGENIEKLLQTFDTASVIVAYNGASFDMQVMRQYYGGDTARWEAHMRKLHDPMHEANRASGGRRVRLSTLLHLNGLRGKQGVGCDAPGLWAQGKLIQLERYCARDAAALAELVLLTHARVPGQGVTTRVGVRQWLLVAHTPRATVRERGARGRDEGE